MTRRLTHAAALALAPASLRALNPPPRAPVAPPAPAKRPGRGSARPMTPGALPGALDAAAGVVVVELPGLRLVNPLNRRQGWRVVSVRGRREKAAVGAALRGRTPPALPALVTITRVSPGRLDSDGAVASAKHVRDAVSAWLGCDDGDPRVTWRVAQERTRAGIYGVRLDIRGWDASRVGARVVAEGAVQRAELVLDAGALRAWAESLSAMADGTRADSRLALGDVEILVRAAGGAR